MSGKINISAAFKGIVLKGLCALTSLLVANLAVAQIPELSSPITLSGVSTTANFYVGASDDNGASFSNSFAYAQAVDLLSEFEVESQHINTVGNLYVVIQVGEQLYMQLESGGFELWDSSLDTLQAARANKVVLTLGSDFGRTPYYNAGGGKDHWPIGSAIIIQQGASWGNRVVGATDNGHNALNINASTLQLDSSSNGIRLEPKHLQQALRELSGLDASSAAQLFPLNAESVDFFNSSIQTS